MNIVIQAEASVFKRLGSHSFWHYSLSSPHSLRSWEVSHLTMKIVLHGTLSCLYSIRWYCFSFTCETLYSVSSHGCNRCH